MEQKVPTRQEALRTLHEYNQSDSLRKHAYAVEGVMRYISRKRGEEYQALKEKIGEGLIAAAERYIPDLSHHLDFVEYATPLSNEYRVKAVRGGLYGPDQTPDQVGPGRFSNFTAGIDGLFLVGAGTVGGGVSPCVASGILAGNKAIRYLQS